MTFIGLLFLFILLIESQYLYECNFDYQLHCLPSLQSASFVLFNETSGELRQTASDITAIPKKSYTGPRINCSEDGFLETTSR